MKWRSKLGSRNSDRIDTVYPGKWVHSRVQVPIDLKGGPVIIFSHGTFLSSPLLIKNKFSMNLIILSENSVSQTKLLRCFCFPAFIYLVHAWVCARRGAEEMVRGRLVRVPLSLPRGTWGFNSGHRAWGKCLHLLSHLAGAYNNILCSRNREIPKMGFEQTKMHYDCYQNQCFCLPKSDEQIVFPTSKFSRMV